MSGTNSSVEFRSAQPSLHHYITLAFYSSFRVYFSPALRSAAKTRSNIAGSL